MVESDNLPKPLNDDIKVVLFRSVRELMANIVKHAQAKTARITIRVMKDTIRVRVTDGQVRIETVNVVTGEVRSPADFGLDYWWEYYRGHPEYAAASDRIDDRGHP